MSIVEREFKKLIFSRKGHHTLKMRRDNKAQMVLRIRRGGSVKQTTMRKYLQAAGIRIDETGYSDADMIELIKFVLKKNQFGKDLGAHYLLDQWKLIDKTKTVL
jgi:hypothetical protein